jgi:hypothetical protein
MSPSGIRYRERQVQSGYEILYCADSGLLYGLLRNMPFSNVAITVFIEKCEGSCASRLRSPVGEHRVRFASMAYATYMPLNG